jgi:tRNA A-37 threonylcarbamoyl transferase component Bud32
MTNDRASMTRLNSAAPGGANVPRHARSDESSAFDEGGFTPGTLLLGRYRIVGLIGRGGMGEVYRAQDLKLGQSVALKFLPESVHRDPSRLERFLNEVRIARQISHPNVCRVYDVGDVGGHHFISMEFVDGEDLASLLRRIGRLPPDKGVEVARQVCAGLAAAHDRGVLHRDLKPANIMIDGRGHARLADFGLAASVEDLRLGGEVAGTPAYMAPEQIEGRETSTRTDLYALGLVLHEVFTGKRVFENASLHELREMHRKQASSRSSLTSSSLDLDPAIERVIERCLEPDPQKRPTSALAVSAALPGGDPLAAALAAGETPSPELVAQAGSVGGLRPVVGWALLLALLLGLLFTASLAYGPRVYRLAPAMRSPVVLASHAEDMLDKIGYGSVRNDLAYGWRLDREVIRHVRQYDQAPDRWDRVAAADAPAVRYWFRQSPSPLVPYDYTGDVTAEDPPSLTPGMASVVLTPRGRLVSFRAVPAAREDAASMESAPDWAPLFADAGIDETSLKPASPRAVPQTFADVRVAWEGTYPNRPDWPMRIEAASFHGRPVLFEVKGPWAMAETEAMRGADWFDIARNSTQVWVSLAALVLGGWLARRHARAGRADTRSALLVAGCAGLPLLVAWVIGTHHTGNIGEEWARFFVGGFASALVYSLQIWLVYLALEPYVRRRWPESLISWTRLLSGRIRDPLVGRDVLIGLVVGVALVTAGDVAESIPGWLGQAPISPTSGENHLRALGPSGEFLGQLVLRPWRVLSESLLILFLLLLGLIVLRNRWLAYAALVVEFVALAVNREALVLSSLSLVLFVTVVVLLISRLGLLSYVAAMFAFYTINDLPLTLDTSAWFAARSAVVAAILIGVGLWSFYTAMGGRPAFETAFE